MMKSLRIVVLSLALGLQACGGGGGGDSGGETGGTNPPPSNGGTGGASGPAGSLWHTGTMVNKDSGTKRIRLSDGSSSFVNADREAMPWPDGSQFALWAHDTSAQTTTLTIIATASGQALYQVTVDGFFRDLEPSPVSKSVLMGRWTEGTSSTPVYKVVFDLAQNQVLHAVTEADAATGWLPDGRLVRVTQAGAIQTVALGGAEAASGSTTWPADRVVDTVDASPSGQQLLVQLHRRDAGTSTNFDYDYWIVPLTGGAAERFTNANIAFHAQWAPDGNWIAFERDTGSGCTGASCFGSCRLRYAAATARNVTGLETAGDSQEFSALDSFGQRQTLGCGLLSWVP
jgi:hypothetical protein